MSYGIYAGMTSTVKTRESDEPAGGAICGICRKQISRYTCPTCNLLYCNLACFRSELHAQCSETFYRKEIEIGLKSDSSKSERDRNRVIDLLNRIEDQSAPDEDGVFHDSDEENDSDSLARRFSAVDMSSASVDDLLRLLTQKERDKFFVALQDPSSELARELLESVELEKTRQQPWWDTFSDNVETSLKPGLMVVPEGLIGQASRGVSLLYNISAVLLAYAYTTRHLAMSPLSSTTNDLQDQYEARRIFSKSVPFLVARESKLLHVSLMDAVVSFWSRLDPRAIDDKTILVLLEDVAKLVRPRRITWHSSGEQEHTGTLTADHPSATTIMVISDIGSLFGNHADSSTVVHRKSHVDMRLTFYAAHILSTPTSHLHALADEVILLSKSIDKEAPVAPRLER